MRCGFRRAVLAVGRDPMPSLSLGMGATWSRPHLCHVRLWAPLPTTGPSVEREITRYDIAWGIERCPLRSRESSLGDDSLSTPLAP